MTPLDTVLNHVVPGIGEQQVQTNYYDVDNLSLKHSIAVVLCVSAALSAAGTGGGGSCS
jgi:hypothetical protein